MAVFPSDPQICRQCGGLCCQGHPGAYGDPGKFMVRYFPDGFVDVSFLRTALPFIGMELRNLAGVPVPTPRLAPWGCIHLGPAGCRLEENDRPEQCRALNPSLDTLMEGEIKCTLPAEFGTGAIRDRWRSFWGLV